MEPPTVLVVGAASRDLAGDDPRGWRLGGGVSYGGLTLARLGLRVRALIGTDAEASRASELDLLREAGADVQVVKLDRGPVFENIDGPAGRRQRCLSVSDVFGPAALPAGWGDEGAVLFAPVAAELAADWAAVPSPAAQVALGWQGLLRTVRAGSDVERRAPEPSPLLRGVDIVGVSPEDLDPETRVDDLLALLPPTATLLVTRGAAGGLAVGPVAGGRRAWRRYPAIESDGVVDPTGAGDTFLAALLASRLDPAGNGVPPGRGGELRFAAAAASLTVERPGMLGVPSRDAVAARLGRSAAGPATPR
ncbi:MAG: PfkB family carbohydrate kinase [Chloroflexota bacterium]